jgi:hypothetical protein
MIEKDIDQIEIVSDPNAEGFYQKLEAIGVGRIESRPTGRPLPKLVYNIKNAEQVGAGNGALCRV